MKSVYPISTFSPGTRSDSSQCFPSNAYVSSSIISIFELLYMRIGYVGDLQ